MKKDQLHRKSIRLKGYDYSLEGVYFITICVKDWTCLFGVITDGEMILNEMGQIAHDEWLKTSELRKNVELDVFVIMPNHIHVIIGFLGRGELHSHIELNSPITKKGECNSPLRGPSNNIGSIVGGYKSSVTKRLNLLNIGQTVWQRNYFEHIIRDEQSYQTISNYIVDNPANWSGDKFYNF